MADEYPVERLRLVVDYDPYPSDGLEHLEQWDTAEKYEGNPVYVDFEMDMDGRVISGTGRELTFDEYIESFGNYDNYTVLMLRLQHIDCERCNTWTAVGHSMTTDVYHGPYVEYPKSLFVPETYAWDERDSIPECIKDVAMDMFREIGIIAPKPHEIAKAKRGLTAILRSLTPTIE